MNTTKNALIHATGVVDGFRSNKHGVSETITPDGFTLILDKKEKPVGIQLADKYVHLSGKNKKISDAIEPGSTLTIDTEPRAEQGFVQEQGLTVYHLKSIRIDGQSFSAHD